MPKHRKVIDVKLLPSYRHHQCYTYLIYRCIKLFNRGALESEQVSHKAGIAPQSALCLPGMQAEVSRK